ncbi:hypothetical protein N7520_004470 [Penicillium odoratum]|uniref:uncharacterized protein n=1 Tax=Penicillium odoratum TaxID=1167516 RepID=UPI002546E1D4|nr:uncharacterized protein N7520_004470 [Penicillium odoratum]KAJ5764911.1 hypothetical protein N7520_004470 [Penicillium odoratum]
MAVTLPCTMFGLDRKSVYSPGESTARIVWAAHILFYLTNNRKHEELHEDQNNLERDNNADDSSDYETDYETEKNVILSSSRDSVRQKFLDCIAQLLSPCKGWDWVTAAAIREGEEGVEVDITRNDGFVSDEENERMSYCKMLEEYLDSNARAGMGSNTTATSLSKFELKAIRYMSRRIDDWVKDLQKTLKTSQLFPDWSSLRWLGQEAEVESWTTITNLLRQFNTDMEAIKHNTRVMIVQKAYNCLKSTQIRQVLSDAFGTPTGLKLWSQLSFIARPLLDCRLLASIAVREPQFGNCKILVIPSRSMTKLEARYVVGIFEAWERLEMGSTPEHVIPKLTPFGQKFEQACAKAYYLHAEMQLVMHYEEKCAHQPTLNYFGCSKKTCLLCETFLGALPSPISTRGRHGVCYPAWAVPSSNSDAIEATLGRVESSLIARIQEFVADLMHPTQKSLAVHVNVKQSGLVSDFSHFTVEDWRQREQALRFFKDKQTIRHKDQLILEGFTPTTESRYHPLENFELKDCCVMCNKSPGIKCAQCGSTYYCSGDCRESDFPSHSLLCEQFATQRDRPSPEHKRAIFFPVDREKPCLIWIRYSHQYDEDGIRWTKVDPYPYLGTDEPIKGVMRIEHNPVRCRNLGSGYVAFSPSKEGYCVSLIHREAYLIDGSKTNRSISASVRASCTSTTPHAYRGPMIALQEIPQEDYADITLGDFRHLMDYLRSYQNTHIRESVPDLQHRAPTTVRGVKICCHGEVKLHGSVPFVSVDIARANKISLGSGSISPITVCLGMPIRLWKEPDSEFRTDPPGWEGGMGADSNPNVAFLMMETNTFKDEWGWAPMYWNSEIGNVWAAREDGQDLAVNDMAMMCHFARHRLQRMFEDVMESDSSSVSRQRVLDFITWKNMITYWDETSEH